MKYGLKTKKELDSARKELEDARIKLQQTHDEDEIIEYAFKIKKLKGKVQNLERKIGFFENIENMEKENEKIRQENKRLREIKQEKQRQRLEIERKNKERLFKKLYVDLKMREVINICDCFNIKHSSREKMLQELTSNHSEEEIIETLKLIKKVPIYSNDDFKPITELIRHEYRDKIPLKYIKFTRLSKSTQNKIKYIEDKYPLYFSDFTNGIAHFRFIDDPSSILYEEDCSMELLIEQYYEEIKNELNFDFNFDISE